MRLPARLCSLDTMPLSVSCGTLCTVCYVYDATVLLVWLGNVEYLNSNKELLTCL